MGHHAKKALGSTVTKSGVEFRVWAPFAKQVSVFVNDSFHSTETYLESEKNGYWSGLAKGAVAGQSYKYHIQTQADDWVERNDPYARQLTLSDGGASVIADPNFDWGKSEAPIIPKEEQIIYELHIGTFNRPDASTPGTFESAVEKLDYLQGLGINMIEIMPVTTMPAGQGWGYAPTSLFAVENAYGGRHGLLSFVKACHERGIGVILDVVYNHVSDHTDLWQFDGWSEGGRGGIYFYNDERADTPWGARPDYGRPEVRQFILDNVAMWLAEYRLDGLRVDSTIFMRNTEGNNDDPAHDLPEAWSLMQEINALAHKINPHAITIAEDYSINDYLTKPVSEGGAGFDAQWGTSFPLAIRKRFAMENHDFGGTLSGELEHFFNGQAFQKVVYGDSHDTAANGWTRLNEATTPGNAASVFARQRALLANALALTAPGIPMILQGEEFLQAGSFNDWQTLEWEKTTQFAGIVLAHQHLINLRKNIYGNAAGLTGPSISVFHEDIPNNVIAYHRWKNGGENDDVLVIINFSDIRFDEYKIHAPLPGTWHVRFNSSWKGYSPDFNETKTSKVTTDKNLDLTIELADYNVLILAQDSKAAA
jgi:1,4-alpha-glucan branching enzyme